MYSQINVNDIEQPANKMKFEQLDESIVTIEESSIIILVTPKKVVHYPGDINKSKYRK